MKLLSLPSAARVSVLVSGFERWRPAACSPIGVGGLLGRPPFGEAGGRESHFLPARPPSRALRYPGARRRGQELPHVLPLACESHSQRDALFVLHWCVHPVLFPPQHHHSFTAADPCLGPLVLSVCLEEEENRLRVILRFCSYFTSQAPLRLPPQIMRAESCDHV